MPKDRDLTQRQRCRRTDTIPINVTLERAAYDILQRFSPPGRQGTGRFIEWLLANHLAREQGREPLPRLPHAAQGRLPTVAASPGAQRSRRAEVRTVNLTLSRAWAETLARYCPEGTRGKGRFLARLLYEHKAREEAWPLLPWVVRVCETHLAKVSLTNLGSCADRTRCTSV
jgi:hypothetical protein